METVQWIISVRGQLFEAIQLNNKLSHLRTSLPRAHVLIDRAEWGRFKHKDLAELLSQLKDTTYDAEDLLREFDDQELRQKVEDADRSRAGQLFSSSLNIVKGLISGSKKRIEEAQSKLDKVVAEIEVALNFTGLNVEQLMPETSSVIGVPEVVGRDEERDLVIEMLGVTIGRDNERDQVIKLLGVPLTRATGKRAALGRDASTSGAKRLKGEGSRGELAAATEINCPGKVCVLPIVGIGGVGKTTLAQFIYNDARVKAHFDVRMWVCVSDLFDKRRITKEIIEAIDGVEYNSRSLDALQVQLMEQVMCRKFLLVLDDVWQNANVEWEAFYAPLRHGLAGSMVLVTTRFQNVADHVTRLKPVQLKGLPTGIFWEFFKNCAFGKELPESYPQLLEIGQRIASRLCRSPLAAKTLGRLLNSELTERHWRSIEDSELWELQHEEKEILPALQLSYLYLPQKLKRCFVVCSMFPKDYMFKRDEIVEFWVALGLVAASGGSMRPEDIGSRYLDDLRSRFLFQADPKYPIKNRYVMHDLIHDMAQSVSVDECFLMQGLSNQRTMPHTVRHMSIGVDSGALRSMTTLHHLKNLHSIMFGNRVDDQTVRDMLIKVDNEALRRMTCINHLNKLHSLRFAINSNCEIPWFNQLSNILFLSLRGCELVKLPEGICVLNHLRHLDISDSRIKELPEKFYRLYSLQVFDASYSQLQSISQGVTKLVNLRRLALPPRASSMLSKMSELGNLSALQNLSYYTVGTNDGHRIGELKGMNQLSASLYMKGIANVRSIAEAAEARLIDKQYLKELVLQWQGTGSSCSARSDDNGILEALRPPAGIESLSVSRFGGDNFPPSLLNSEYVPTLRKLVLENCLYLRCLTGIDRMQHARLPMKSLTSLVLDNCGLTNVDQFLSPEYLPSIKMIWLSHLPSLESLPVHSFGRFIYLQDLNIHHCWKLVCPTEMVLPHSLRRLSISASGELDKTFPGCLENLANLTFLRLEFSLNVESILLNSINTQNLERLVLFACLRLSSIGGSDALSSIRHVSISCCPMLTEVEQPFEK